MSHRGHCATRSQPGTALCATDSLGLCSVLQTARDCALCYRQPGTVLCATDSLGLCSVLQPARDCALCYSQPGTVLCATDSLCLCSVLQPARDCALCYRQPVSVLCATDSPLPEPRASRKTIPVIGVTSGRHYLLSGSNLQPITSLQPHTRWLTSGHRPGLPEVSVGKGSPVPH